ASAVVDVCGDRAYGSAGNARDLHGPDRGGQGLDEVRRRLVGGAACRGHPGGCLAPFGGGGPGPPPPRRAVRPRHGRVRPRPALPGLALVAGVGLPRDRGGAVRKYAANTRCLTARQSILGVSRRTPIQPLGPT